MPVHHGRNFIEARGKVDREREYSPAEAMRLLKDVKRAKFDESVEVHVRTGLNVRHAVEQLRGSIALPNGKHARMDRLTISSIGTRTSSPRNGLPYSSSSSISTWACRRGRCARGTPARAPRRNGCG